MKWWWWSGMAAAQLCYACVVASAQSADAAVQQITTELIHKTVYLREYPGGTKINETWDGAKLQVVARFHELSAMEIRSIKWKQPVLEIEGTRRAIFRDDNGQNALFDLKESVDLRLTVTSNDIAAAITSAPHAMFFAQMAEALSGLPERERKVLPPPLKYVPRKAISKSTPPTSACPSGAPMQQPRWLEGSARTEFAPQGHGTLSFDFTVDEQGIPKNLWLIRPVGQRMDEEQAEDLARTRFTPPTCDGVPVSTSISIDSSF